MPESVFYQPTPIMEDFASREVGRHTAPMKYLYESTSLVDVQEIVANLCFVSLMASFETIVPEDEECVAAASDVEALRGAAGFYASFVCLVNPAFPPAEFSRVYEACVAYYFDYLQNRLEDFANLFEEWHCGFEDALIYR